MTLWPRWKERPSWKRMRFHSLLSEVSPGLLINRRLLEFWLFTTETRSRAPASISLRIQMKLFGHRIFDEAVPSNQKVNKANAGVTN
jgi:hypothetical protein